jgi:hypothetical protein
MISFYCPVLILLHVFLVIVLTNNLFYLLRVNIFSKLSSMQCFIQLICPNFLLKSGAMHVFI